MNTVHNNITITCVKIIKFEFQINSNKMVIRTESESSEFSELEEAGVEPLSLDDICFNESYASITRYAFIVI